ncbi:replication initiation factor domain-containing protein [Lactococcus garvieae]|uniref:replication initiation factor domain-containing protein n=1 Tax=Lactococcus garvieae TaxID=1363 RepID=UPI0030D09583
MNLKEIRMSRGFSLRIMAKACGIPKNTYVKLEKGERVLTPEVEKKIKERFFFKKNEQAVLVGSLDWVSLHFRTTDIEEVVEKILHLPLSEFTLEAYARYQYASLYRYGAINCYVDPKDAAHGVLIECSGSACRELEQLLKDQGREWYELLNDCFVYEQVLETRFALPRPDEEQEGVPKSIHEMPRHFNVTRLDIALDEFYSEDGNYRLSTLFDRFHEGLVSTRKRSYSSQMGGKFTKEGLYNDGLTLYLGSPQSTPYFRFYEKDAEQAKAMNTSIETIHELYGFKNRYEIVLRGDKANQFIKHYVSEYFDIAEKAVSIINANLVVFSDFEGHLDIEWYTLMNSTDAYHFETKPKGMDVNRTWTWAEKTIFPTMAFLKKENKHKFFEMLGDAKLSKRNEAYLKRKGLRQDE